MLKSQMLSSIVFDIQLVEFYEKKNSTILLLDPSQVITSKRYPLCNDDFRPAIIFPEISTKLGNKIPKIIRKKYNLLHKILKLGKGKLSLCGISILDLICDSQCRLFNLYLHSCSIFKANSIIKGCLKIFGDKVAYNGDTTQLIITNKRQRYCISLIVYKDLQQVLSNNGCGPEKYAYNFKDGYMWGFIAALSLAISLYPIEASVDSEGIRRCNERGIRTMLCNNDISREQAASISITTNLRQNFEGDYFYFVYRARSLPLLMPLPINIKDITTSLYKEEEKQKTSFGKGYKPMIVGISNNKYVAFANCRKEFNLHGDIFRLLCSYWFSAEVDDAIQRLVK